MEEHAPDDVAGPGTGVARRVALEPGLHLVATPIGSARDITLRALDVLLSADAIAAEDTRSARRLMQLHGVPLGGRPLIAYHDHNGQKARPGLIALLENGKSVAYVSEAGTPLVADPGYRLAKVAIDAGLTVRSAPGPSAVIAALSVSGLPSDRFLFAGFPPTRSGERQAWLEQLRPVRATVILYESARRIHQLLADLCEQWDSHRDAALCRELTKRFEDIRRGSLGALADDLDGITLKGEIVLVVGPPAALDVSQADIDAALRDALVRLRVKEASAEVAQTFGLARRDIYQRALALKKTPGKGAGDT